MKKTTTTADTQNAELSEMKKFTNASEKKYFMVNMWSSKWQTN